MQRSMEKAERKKGGWRDRKRDEIEEREKDIMSLLEATVQLQVN